MDTKVGSMGSMDHKGFSVQSIKWIILRLYILQLLRTRTIMQSFLRAGFECNRLAAAHHPVGLFITTSSLVHCNLFSYLLPPPHLHSHLSPPLTHCFVPPSFPPLHLIFDHHSGIGNCSVSHSTCFCSNSFTCKDSLQGVVGVVQAFWSLTHPLWHTLNTGTLLRLVSDSLLLSRSYS